MNCIKAHIITISRGIEGLTGCIDFDCFNSIDNIASFAHYYGVCRISEGCCIETKVTDVAKGGYCHYTPLLYIFLHCHDFV
jgi:hypothetical protein